MLAQDIVLTKTVGYFAPAAEMSYYSRRQLSSYSDILQALQKKCCDADCVDAVVVAKAAAVVVVVMAAADNDVVEYVVPVTVMFVGVTAVVADVVVLKT